MQHAQGGDVLLCGIKCVFAGILDHDLAMGLRIGTTSVLVGPLDDGLCTQRWAEVGSRGAYLGSRMIIHLVDGGG